MTNYKMDDKLQNYDSLIVRGFRYTIFTNTIDTKKQVSDITTITIRLLYKKA